MKKLLVPVLAALLAPASALALDFLTPVVGTLPYQEALNPSVSGYLSVFSQNPLSTPTDGVGSFSGLYASPVLKMVDGGYQSVTIVLPGSSTPTTLDVPRSAFDYQVGDILDFGMDFPSSGAVLYEWSIPYTVSFNFPDAVYPGMVVPLEPVITLGAGGTMGGSQAVSYGFRQSVGVDIPYDGLDRASIYLDQVQGAVNIDAQIPLLPLVDASGHYIDVTSTGSGLNMSVSIPDLGVDINKTIGSSDFVDSGLDALTGLNLTEIVQDGVISVMGNYTQAAGTAVLETGGNPTTAQQDGSGLIYATSGCYMPAWSMDSEQIEIAARVLEMIPTPYTVAAGAILYGIQDAAGLDLDTGLFMGIQREDSMMLRPSEVPTLTVPETLLPGEQWVVDSEAVSLVYEYLLGSAFTYCFGGDVTFDMNGRDPTTLFSLELGSLFAGSYSSEWLTSASSFTVSGTSEVMSEADWEFHNFAFIDPDWSLDLTIDPSLNWGDEGVIREAYAARLPEGDISVDGQTYPLVTAEQTNATVPEPSSLALLGVGLACLLGVPRRRR